MLGRFCVSPIGLEVRRIDRAAQDVGGGPEMALKFGKADGLLKHACAMDGNGWVQSARIVTRARFGLFAPLR